MQGGAADGAGEELPGLVGAAERAAGYPLWGDSFDFPEGFSVCKGTRVLTEFRASPTNF